MASKSVIHPGEESESSADEAYTDEELVTSADLEEIDTSASAVAAGPCAAAQQKRPVRPHRVVDSVLHHKLREANVNLQNSIKSQIISPYQKATRNVQSLVYSLSKVQTSMSEACLLLQQTRDDLKATEEKTHDIVSSDYLVDVKT